MKTRTWIVFAGITSALMTAPGAFAVNGCSTASLSGTFAMQFSGTLAVSGAAVGGVSLKNTGAFTASSANSPVAGISRLFLDGNGNLSGYSSVNARNSLQQGLVTGTYNVNADCSATFALIDASGNIQSFSGVVVGQGTAAFVTQTNSGAGVTGSLRQMRVSCQTSDLVGTFGIQYAAATSATTTGPSGAFTSTGTVALDGLGTALSTETRLAAGVISQVPSSGSITINPDCSTSMTLTSQVDGTVESFMGMVSSDGTQIFLTGSNPGVMSTGAMVAQ